MKKLIIPILLLSSCSSSESPGIIEESTDIVSEYVDNLENTPGDARSVVEDINNKNSRLKQELNKK